MTGQTLGHYQILEKLGAGGIGEVYKARDSRLNRFVAIKVLPPDKVAHADRKRRFIQEAQAASALNHPNIGGDVNPCVGIRISGFGQSQTPTEPILFIGGGVKIKSEEVPEMTTREALHNLVDELPEEQTELARLWLEDLRHAADEDGPLLDGEALASVGRGLADVAAGRVKPLAEYERERGL